MMPEIRLRPHRVGLSEEPDLMRQLITRQNPVIVECGANDGVDSERFLQIFPKARLTCFEPDPRPLMRTNPTGFFSRMVRHPPITPCMCAVADSDGMEPLYRSTGTPPEKTIHETDDWDLSNSLQRPTGHVERHPWVKFPERLVIMVGTIKLDSWLRKVPDVKEIDLLWLDIQGGEARAINGGLETLRRTRLIYAECAESPNYEGQPSPQQLIDMLPDFEPIGAHRGGRWEVNLLFKNRNLA